MKNTYIKTTILIAALLCVNSLSSQVLVKKMLKKHDLRTMPIEFVVPDLIVYPNTETALEIVKRCWKFNSNTKYVNTYKYTKLELRKSNGAKVRFESNPFEFDRVGGYGANGDRLILSIKDRAIATVQMGSSLGRADIAYAVKMMNFMVENQDNFTRNGIIEESSILYAEQLKTKTLLITKKYLGELSLAEIKEVYPYKIEIKSAAFIEKQILTNSPNYLAIHHATILMSNPNHRSTNMKVVFSTDNSTLVAMSLPKVTTKIAKTVNRYSEKLILKDFKRFLKHVK